MGRGPRTKAWTEQAQVDAAAEEGGAHWRQVALWRDTGISAVACPAAGLCLAVGEIPSGNPRNLVRVTRDSGRTWSTQTDPSWQHRFGVGSAEGLRAIACANTSTCVVVGNNGVILTTSDAGATWHPRSL